MADAEQEKKALIEYRLESEAREKRLEQLVLTARAAGVHAHAISKLVGVSRRQVGNILEQNGIPAAEYPNPRRSLVHETVRGQIRDALEAGMKPALVGKRFGFTAKQVQNLSRVRQQRFDG